MLLTYRPHLLILLGLFLAVLFILIPQSQISQPIYFRPPEDVSLSRCPSVHTVGRQLIDHSIQTCYPVLSKISQFTLELCYKLDSCNEFTARISRTNRHECNEAESTPNPSEDPILSNWLRKKRGPDAFYLRTDGAERYASVYSKYLGRCIYEFDVALKNAGQSYLQIWWTFERYTAFSETNTSWPAMLLSPLSDPIVLPACPYPCTMRVAAPLLPTQSIVILPSSGSSLSAAHLSSTTWDPESSMLPNCSSPFPIPGSFLPAHPLDVIYPPEILPQPQGKPVVGRYSFIPESCVWRHSGLRFGNPSRCTQQQKKMFIMGDSHGRVLYDTIVHRLRGRRDILSESEKVGSKNAVIDQLEINFLWDPRGNDFLASKDHCSERVKNSDIVIVSTVVHWHSSPTSVLLSQLHSILTAVSACPYTPPSHAPHHQKRKQILLFSPAAIQRQDEFVIEHKDHRTNIRLQYWRDESLKMAEVLGWDMVDQFALTLPHSMEPLATDAGHYLANDGLDPIVDEVLGKTGLCD